MRARRELPKRVMYLDLFDSLQDWDGGEGRVFHNLLRDFPWVLEEGWEIELWGLRRRNGGPSQSGLSAVRGLIVPRRALPRALLPLVVWASQFVQTVLRPQAGVLIAYGPIIGTGAVAGRLVRPRSSVLVIRIVNDFWSRNAQVIYGRRLESRILHALERFVLRRADLVLPMSSFTHHIARRAGTPEHRIVELPRPTQWLGTEAAPTEQTGPVRVACAARLVAEKGFDVLIAAFAELTEEFPDAQLDVAGHGPERSNLERLAGSLGVADRVRFRGWIEDMAGFFSGALIAVLPSRINEGLGMVLVEAGLAGCALVGTDVGGVRDIVHPERTGILVPPDDPRALADALRTLLRDPARARRLGAGAQGEARAYLGRRDEALQQVRARLNALRTARSS